MDEQVGHLKIQLELVHPSSHYIYLGVLLVVVLLGTDPARDQVVFDAVGQRKVVVTGGGHIAVLDQRIVQVPVERLLHLAHILHLGDAPNTNLLPLITVRHRLRHD